MADCGGFGNIDFLVKLTGLSDAGLRLVLALFSAYPLAFIYHAFFYRKNPVLQHAYFMFCGLCIAAFCYGWCFAHSMITIVSSYLLLHMIGPSIVMVVSMFLFNLGYLLTSYAYYASGEYDVNWTTPQCILTLRLISVAWDYYDGNQDQEKLPSDFKVTAIKAPPTLLQMFGLSYFYGGFLVGPQFQIKEYVAFVEGTLVDKKDDNSSRVSEGLKRLFLGIMYLCLYAVLEPYLSIQVLLSNDFKRFSFLVKVVYVILFSKVALMKYLAVWCLSEGSCIISGIGYNGRTEDGKVRWDGVRNVKLSVYETIYTFQHIIDSFNINTNKWVFRYVFKRLRFLGNKNLSHLLALMFLALWHGLFIGYFFCFFGEFLIMLMEKQVFNMCYTVTKKPLREMPAYIKIPVIVVYVPIVLFGIGYFNVAFNLLTFPRFHELWVSLYYIVPLVLLVWHVSYPILIYPLFKRLTREEKERSKKEN
ncbi:lysophospholipid acyltransferase 5-like isoform X1 [Acropora palmata]|uniref:lysophospholipid acyltransferase 5-like isoform X1 n=2 Tax=Acropora palmata TaxID=6131 RepID=UPI003DA07040